MAGGDKYAVNVFARELFGPERRRGRVVTFGARSGGICESDIRLARLALWRSRRTRPTRDVARNVREGIKSLLFKGEMYCSEENCFQKSDQFHSSRVIGTR